MIDLSAAWITGWIFARLQTISSWPVPYSLSGLKRGHTDYKKTGETFSLEFLKCNLYSPNKFFLFFYELRTSSTIHPVYRSMNRVSEEGGEAPIQTDLMVTGD